MLEFFTVLILTYYVEEEPWYVKVIYDTEDRCQEAMDRGVLTPLYEQLYDLYGNRIMLRCHTTEFISSEVRPKARPDGETEDG